MDVGPRRILSGGPRIASKARRGKGNRGDATRDSAAPMLGSRAAHRGREADRGPSRCLFRHHAVRPQARPAGRMVDFDRIYAEVIAPAVEAAGLAGIRADEEQGAGFIHKLMYERILLSEYAIADLTLLNANVYYELGIRHAARPETTVLTLAQGSPLPFDVGPLRALPYALNEDGAPADPASAKTALTQRLVEARQHRAMDSPLFQLLEGYQAAPIDRLKTDVFRTKIAMRGGTESAARQGARGRSGRARPVARQPGRHGHGAGGRRGRSSALLSRGLGVGSDRRSLPEARHGVAAHPARARAMGARSQSRRPRPRSGGDAERLDRPSADLRAKPTRCSGASTRTAGRRRSRRATRSPRAAI